MNFYTQERWKNWLERVKESKFTLDEDREGLGPEGIVFLDMQEDVILALCKLTGKLRNNSISAEDAQKALADMETWVFSDADPLGPDKDAMLHSVQTALYSAFRGALLVLEGNANPGEDIANLLLEADAAEKDGKVEDAFALAYRGAGAAFCGARFESDAVLEQLSSGLVADWADGIDGIQAVLAGGVNLADEEDDGE